MSLALYAIRLGTPSCARPRGSHGVLSKQKAGRTASQPTPESAAACAWRRMAGVPSRQAPCRSVNQKGRQSARDQPTWSNRKSFAPPTCTSNGITAGGVLRPRRLADCALVATLFRRQEDASGHRFPSFPRSLSPRRRGAVIHPSPTDATWRRAAQDLKRQAPANVELDQELPILLDQLAVEIDRPVLVERPQVRRAVLDVHRSIIARFRRRP